MFKIVHDLSALSTAERAEYCRDFASYLGLNPDENRIDTIWMNDNNVRSLVAYCRRGTTDILREIHGIDITDMQKEDGPGYVSFKAFGINRRGRKEVAVGAFATTGCSGDKLAAAIATAETRAGRRLTLKFVGSGLLDESEVSNTVISEPTPVAPPAVQPQIKPNTEVGKLSGYMNDKLQEDKPEATPEAMPELIQALSPLQAAVNAILAKDTPSDSTAPVKKTRKPRRSKNEVDMGPVDPEAKVTGLTYVPTCPVCNQFMVADERLDLFLCIQHAQMHATMKPSMLKSAPAPVAVPVNVPVAVTTPVTPVPAAAEPVTIPIPPPKAISVLTDAEQKQVKARLAPFWVDILPKGGMTADDGISIWGKLIKFANTFFPDSPDYKKWTFSNWESFFEFLDEYNAAHGASELVTYINGKVSNINAA